MFRRFAPVVMASLMLAPAASFAKDTFPVPPEGPPRRYETVDAPVHFEPHAPNGTSCRLGIDAVPDLAGELFPPDDVYYMLMQPTSCGPCSLVSLVNVHVMLEFRKLCAVPIRISVFNAFGSPCPRPDPAQRLFGAFDTLVTPGDYGYQEFIVPLPEGWKLTAPAFLSIQFTGGPDSCSATDESPRLAFREGCPHCVAYNGFSDSIDDVCSTGVGLPVMSAEVSECVFTPVLRRSWGAVKVLYR